MTPRMRTLLGKLPTKYRWTLHNVVGHPLMGLLQLVGADELAEAAHFHTMPLEKTVAFDTETTPNAPFDIAELNRKGIRGRGPLEWLAQKDKQ